VLDAVVLLKVVPTRASLILERISRLAGVRKSFSSYGRFDIVVFVEVEDYKKMRLLTTQINCIEGIRSTETLPQA
jgi:uncharacterized protein with GYD domain